MKNKKAKALGKTSIARGSDYGKPNTIARGKVSVAWAAEYDDNSGELTHLELLGKTGSNKEIILLLLAHIG